MQVVHVLNSGVISGPEMLVVPALRNLQALREVWSLEESRLPQSRGVLSGFCARLGLPVRSLEVRSRFDVCAIFALMRLIRGLPEGSIVHCHDVKASFYIWVAKILSRHPKLRLFATHHGSLVRDHWCSRLYEQMFVFITRCFFDRLLCVSNNEYLLLKKRGVPESTLKRHTNGINRPSLAWEQRSVNLSNDDEFKLVILARLSSEKNHCRALKVLSEVKQKYALRWSLDLLGEGCERSRIVSLAESLGIAQNVHLKGFVPEAWRLLDRYHCLLSFSLGEGLPVSLLEAGWRRTPVFASAVGGVPEVCADGAGALFSLQANDEQIADQLVEFLHHAECLRSSAEKLFNRVSERFSEQRWLDELNEHYTRAVGD